MDFTNPIPGMVSSTGLPLNVWPKARPQLGSKLPGCHYELRDKYKQYDLDFNNEYSNWIKIGDNTVTALRHLPAVHMLGQATFVRTPTQITTMVSIAEAAHASMDEDYCQLLWVMVRVIDSGLRCSGRGYQYLHWQQEISREEHIEERLRKQNYEVSTWRGERRSHLWRALLKEVIEMKEKQIKLQHELELTRRQNEENLRILRAMSQGMPVEDIAADIASPKTLLEIIPTKYYTSMSTTLRVREKYREWFLCVNKGDSHSENFRVLFRWLEVRLGGTTEFLYELPIEWISIDRLSVDRAKSISAQKPQDGFGCWRRKILSGPVLELAGSDVEQSAESAAPQSLSSKDCLLLTAAALWSLFDNALERMPGCKCTFKAAQTDFIQCRIKEGEWLVWHLFSDGPFCEGNECAHNIQIALTAEEPGERLYTTTPCALGWPALRRHCPNSIIWTELKATTTFKNRTATKYEIQEFQATAQLSVPAPVSPQFDGTVTFAKRYYEIANSVDHESIVAMERVAAAVVLIFDEKKKLHLTCDGADIIEMCCLQSLKEMGCKTLPQCSHPSALLRLETWCTSSFESVRHTYFTGDHMVRQVTKRISEVLETTKKAINEEEKFLYWLLEDILGGRSGRALKAPSFQDVSWHELASKAPPLIFVVGELNPQYLTLIGNSLKLSPSPSKFKHWLEKVPGLSGKIGKSIPPGGVASSDDIMKRWLNQGRFYVQAELSCTSEQVFYGNNSGHVQCTYQICKGSSNASHGAGGLVAPVFPGCTCDIQDNEKQCLHYIQ